MHGCIATTFANSRRKKTTDCKPVVLSDPNLKTKAASDCNHSQSLAVLHEACKLRMEG